MSSSTVLGKTVHQPFSGKKACDQVKSMTPNACGVCGCRYVFHGTLLDTEEKDWDQSFDINVKSMFHTSKTCVRMVRGDSCE